MNKLVVFAVLGLGLTQAMVACSSDTDDSSTGGSGGAAAGTAGKGSGGTAAGGASAGGHGGSAGGSSVAGKGGSTAGGTSAGGTSAGGTSAGGTSAGGTSAGGTAGGGKSGGGTGGSSAGAPEGGMAGADMGEGGAPPVEPVQATEYWLGKYCDSISEEKLMCTQSTPWGTCYDDFHLYLSTVAGAICPKETDMDNFPLTIAIANAFDDLATACADPSTAKVTCNAISGYPQFANQACQDANDKALQAASTCGAI